MRGESLAKSGERTQLTPVRASCERSLSDKGGEAGFNVGSMEVSQYTSAVPNNKGNSLLKEILRENLSNTQNKGNPVDKGKGRNNSGQSINKYCGR